MKLLAVLGLMLGATLMATVSDPIFSLGLVLVILSAVNL